VALKTKSRYAREVKFRLSQPLLDRLFRIGITIKGLDGLVEVIGGVLLLFLPMGTLHGWASISTYHLLQDNHAFIAHTLMKLDQQVTAGVALFAALYLLGHGFIKIALAAALLRRHYRVYPWAIGFLLLFIFYQSYRIGYDHSTALAILTGLDAIITWLVYLEWRRHTPKTIMDHKLPTGPNNWSPKVTNTALFTIICGILVASAAAIALAWPQAIQAPVVGAVEPAKLQKSVDDVRQAVANFKTRQIQVHTELASAKYLDEALAQINTAINQQKYSSAARRIADLKAMLAKWNTQLDTAGREAIHDTPTAPHPAASHPGALFIPIVLYHYTPANFEQQLEHLDRTGYTTVDLDQVAAALAGTGTLPTKPVVITYDDGFADQMTAFNLLKAHHMKATFYIINGGPLSKWCIGASRRYNDPLQPPQGCGDSYMTWDQVRQLDRSGLMTIGGHTLDHSNLAALSPDEQRHEIADSKAGIEQQIGHSIRHFAYPYGNYNATTIGLVQQAGYITAVTVEPGDYQTPGQPFVLKRIRDTLSLP